MTGVALGVILGLLLRYLGIGSGQACAAGYFAAVLMIVIHTRLDLRRRWWFWTAVGSIVGMHAPVILLVHWTRVDRILAVPLGVVDFLAMLTFIGIIEERVQRHRTGAVANHSEAGS